MPECPHCSLLSPPDTDLCDCGFDFRLFKDEQAHNLRKTVIRPKTLPKRLGLGGAVATTLSLGTALALDEANSLHVFFRYDYVLMGYVVIPLFLIGAPTGFVGTIWWARQLKPSTCIATAWVLFFICALIFLGKPNIHGDAGGLLLLVLLPALLLGAILLEKGLTARRSK